ncbi:hypothetical protein JW865_06425 [Candidatus Bathyarchaeota archaeon]|nr:hypothetical protein [Candidatus Bathyarchaeota archaeon]
MSNKKTLGIIAIVIGIIAISALTLPALAAPNNYSQNNSSGDGICDQDCDQTQTRLMKRDGSCYNGTNTVNGTQIQNRYCYYNTNGCEGTGSQYRHQNKNGN